MSDRTLFVDECRLIQMDEGGVGLVVQGWVRGPGADRPLVVIETTGPAAPIRLLVPLNLPRPDVPVAEDEVAYGFRASIRGELLAAFAVSEAHLVIRSRWAESSEVLALLGAASLTAATAAEDATFGRGSGAESLLSLDTMATSGYSWSRAARSTLDHYIGDLTAASPRRRMAVIGHAHDAGGWFPYWYSHYSRSVGPSNIYITTPLKSAFDEFELGGVIGLADWTFSNHARAALHSGLLQGLLARYESVLLADIDEIVVSSLDYDLPLSELPIAPGRSPGIRTLGFDVAQLPDELPFDFGRRILDQRTRGVANTGLFKSSLIYSPQFVSIGFHGSSERLDFAEQPLILLHLKRADADVESRQLLVSASADLVADRERRYQLDSARVRLPALEPVQTFAEFLAGGFVQRFVDRSRLDPFGYWTDDPAETDTRPVDLATIFSGAHAAGASIGQPAG